MFKKRITLTMVLILLASALPPVFLLGFFGSTFLNNSIKVLHTKRHENHLKLVAERVLHTIHEAEKELTFLTTDRMMRPYFDAKDEDTRKKALKIMEDDFLSFIESHGQFLHVRFIGERGMEIVRVERMNGNMRVVPNDELQYKGDRYYFTKTISLGKGKVYVSPLDLNREGSPPKVEVPYRPVIRFSTLVFDERERVRGILIFSLDASNLLTGYEEASGKHDHVLLVNQDGYYVKHPLKNEKEWGGPADLNTGENFKKDYPENVFSGILSGKSGVVEHDGKIMHYYPVFYKDNSFWVLVESHKVGELLSPVSRFKTIFYLMVTLSIIAVICAGIFFNRRITNPILKLQSWAKTASKGDDVETLNIKMKGEIGELSDDLNAMADKFKHSVKVLREVIENKTSQLFKTEKTLNKVEEKLNRVEKLTNKDELTGLYDQRFFASRFHEETIRATRFTHNLSLIIADIDNFKKYNDTYGHKEGDKVLKAIADIIKHAVREIDIVSRHGGGGVTIILPEAKRLYAVKVAERIREAVETYRFIQDGVQPVEDTPKGSEITMSFGIAAIYEDGDGEQIIIKKAESALHQAKKEGKNKVFVFEE